MHTLANPTPAAGDEFGTAVAISGTAAIVGTEYDDTGATDAGAAYVFDTTTGSLLCALANPMPAVGDRFGHAVALSGGTAVVGTPYADGTTVDRGAAYVFDVGRSPTDIGLSSTSVAEKQPVGTVVGSFSTTDPYYPADPHTYTLVAGAGDTDNALFTVDADGRLLTAASFDYMAKNSFSIRVRTTNPADCSFEKQFTITVTDSMYAMTDPSTLPQLYSLFGGAVATDGNFTVVGTVCHFRRSSVRWRLCIQYEHGRIGGHAGDPDVSGQGVRLLRGDLRQYGRRGGSRGRWWRSRGCIYLRRRDGGPPVHAGRSRGGLVRRLRFHLRHYRSRRSTRRLERRSILSL